MKLSNNVKAFLLGVVAFLALDAVYLGSTSNMWNQLLVRISGEKIQSKCLTILFNKSSNPKIEDFNCIKANEINDNYM